MLIALGVWLGIAMLATVLTALFAADDTTYELRISRQVIKWAWLWPILIFVRLAKGLKVLAAGRSD